MSIYIMFAVMLNNKCYSTSNQILWPRLYKRQFTDAFFLAIFVQNKTIILQIFSPQQWNHSQGVEMSRFPKVIFKQIVEFYIWNYHGFYLHKNLL